MFTETYEPSLTRMPEGEVALRLAFHLLNLPKALPSAIVCLDRHHISSGGKLIFHPRAFLLEYGWTHSEQAGKHSWLGTYEKQGQRLVVSANSRGGDVIAQIGTQRVRAECKKGNLQRTKGNPENKLVHEAIGQLMAIEEFNLGDVLLVAVPYSEPHLRKLELKSRPLLKQIGISIVLVGRDGTVAKPNSMRLFGQTADLLGNCDYLGKANRVVYV